MFNLNFKEIINSIKPIKVINPVEDSRGFNCVSIDSRTLVKNDIFIAFKGKNFDANDFLEEAYKRGAACIIAEKEPPSVPQDCIVLIVENGIKAMSMLARAVRNKTSSTVVGITGSYGKTTTKEMLAFILGKANRCLFNIGTENNIIGVSKAMLRLNELYSYAVFELGTNHFGEIAELSEVVDPSVVVLTGIGEVHTEFLNDKEGVLKEKSSVFKVSKNAKAVLNGDDPMLRKLDISNKSLFFGIDKSNDIYFEIIENRSDKIEMIVNGKYDLMLNTIGKYNAYNATAAIAAANALGVELKDAVEALAGFEFPTMRLELITKDSIQFLNDAYNSNPEALSKSLEAFGRLSATRKIVVLADMLELGELSEQAHITAGLKVSDMAVDYALFIGPMMEKAYCECKKTPEIKAFYFAKKTDLKRKLYEILQSGDAVFLKGSRSFRLETLMED